MRGDTELLFSYGTLQHEDVQRATFGRTLTGSRDALPLFVTMPLDKTAYAIATWTGAPSDLVAGTVYSLTPADLIRADEYECAPYERVVARLQSGRRAWVYVDGRRKQVESTSGTGTPE